VGLLQQIRRPALLLAWALGLVVFAACCFGADDNDTPWHLATGRLVVHTGTFPTADPFSHLLDGSPWIAEYWLFQILIYPIWWLGGDALLVLAKAAWVAALFTAAGAVLVARGKTSWELWALLSLPVLLILADRLALRPELVTWGALLAFMLILPRGLDPLPRHAFWALPAIQMLWTNAHPGFLLGPFLLGLAAGARGLTCLWRGEKARLKSELMPFGILLVLVSVATLATPYGWRLLALPFTITQSDAYSKLITEWNPTSLGRLWYHRQVVWIFALPLLLGLALNRGDRDALPYVWGVGLAYLASQAVRHNTIWSLGALVLLAEAWGPISLRFVAARERRGRIATACVGTLLLLHLLAIVTNWWWHAQGSYRQFGLQANRWRYPADEANFAMALDWKGNLFNDYNIGGDLLWRLTPKHRISIDGRLVPYPEALLDEAMAVTRGARPWEPFFEMHGIGWVVVSNEAETLIASLWQSPNWRLVFAGPRAVVFARAIPEHRTIIDRWGLDIAQLDRLARIKAEAPSADDAEAIELSSRGWRIFAPPTPYEALRRSRLLVVLGRADLAARVMRAQLALWPETPDMAGLLPPVLLEAGRWYLAKKQWSEAQETLALLTRLEPRNANAWNNLGVAFARDGRKADAAQAWDEALKLEPHNAAIRQNLAKVRPAGP